jgi:uncharacterized protein
VKINGKAALQAGPERVWTALNDPAVLVATIPGCERLETTGPDRYRMTITAGVASIKGTYVGDVELADPNPPSEFSLRASGAGAPGTVSADVRVTLTGDGGTGTLLKYSADAVVGGPVGGVGQRVLAGVARRTATEFFTAVDAHIAAQDAGPVTEPETAPAPAAQPEPAGPVMAAPAAAPPTDRRPVERDSVIDLSERRPDSSVAAASRSVPVVYTRPSNPAATGTGDLTSHALAALFGAAVALLAAWVGGRISRRR